VFSLVGKLIMRVLIVEDSAKMGQLLRRALKEDGYAADLLASGVEAIAMAVEYDFDAIVLDVGLPDIDGFEVCRRLRQAGRSMPVLMLTARDAVPDRVHGLDTGADDYLTKPFDLDELRARLRALLRRSPGDRPIALVVDDLTLDPATRAVHRGGTPIELAPKEFAVLEHFMRHAGEVITRGSFLEHVWDFAYEGDSNLVDVYVRFLREKIDRPFNVRSIETVRGAGYRLRGQRIGYSRPREA
jgi:two-component system OmpR family response regulator